MQHDSFSLALPILLASIAAMLAAAPGDPPAAQKAAAPPRILVFTRTMGFRHDSIPDGIAAVKRIAEGRCEVDATEDPLVFSD